MIDDTKRKISIRDISVRAGVSIATVSRVINGRGKYSQTTEKKVWDIVRDCNYFTNIAARSLRTSRNKVIGLILPDLTNELFASITISIEKQLFAKGYSNIICNAPFTDNYQRRYQSLLDIHNVAGIISLFDQNFGLDDLPSGIPVVFVGTATIRETTRNTPYAWIFSDYRTRSFEATCELITNGCRKIAYLMRTKYEQADSYKVQSQRYIGFFEALTKHGLYEENSIISSLSDSSVECAYSAMRALLELHGDIDGVFCNSAHSAVGSIYALRCDERRVPEDVKVVSFDDTSMSRFYSPQITSVYIDGEQYASLAVKCMLDLVEGKPLPQKEFEVESRLIVRETTRYER